MKILLIVLKLISVGAWTVALFHVIRLFRIVKKDLDETEKKHDKTD